MDNCFVACGCDEYDGITTADLDRFTDTIENVLNDDKGRKLFRNFMYTSKMRDGRRTLDFLEHIDKLLNFKEGSESSAYPRYLRDLDRLIDEAERIEELDFATMERITIARDSEDKEQIVEVLKILKAEATKALKKEYNAFRRHFVQKK
ncbi:uncharacterized protein ACR2FA_006749 [Aphomia sociella]